MALAPGPVLPAGVAVVGLVLLGTGQLTLNRARIEDDLRERSAAALASAGYGDVAVSVSGRDLTLTGPAGPPAELAAATRLVAGVDGVRVATAEPAAADPAAVPTPSPGPSPTLTPGPTPVPSPSRSATAAPTPTPTPSAGARTTGPPNAAQVARRLRALPRIEFTSTLIGLSADGRETVRRAAAILRRSPDLRVRVDGHTDSFGTDQVNRDLSRARAMVVRDALVTAGVSADRLRVVGFGESRPLVAEHTAADGAVNRRVVLTVLR